MSRLTPSALALTIAAAAIALAVLSPQATAQVSQPAQEATLIRLVNAISSMAADVRKLLATETRLPPGKPLGQVGDALKVYPVADRPYDPCSFIDKGNVAVSQTASSRLVVGHPGERIFVCSVVLVAGAAEVVNFIEGTGTTCGTGTLAVGGSTTAANGLSFAANGGMAEGGGLGTIMATTKVSNDLCLSQSGANRVSGAIVYAYGKP